MKVMKISTWCVVAVAAGLTAGCKDSETTAGGMEATPEAVATAPVAIPGAPAATPAAPAADPSANVVTVNGKSLTRGELDKELDMITASPQFAAMPPEQSGKIRTQMESRVVDRFVSQQVLSAAAETEKIEATTDEVDTFITGIRGTLPEGVTLESIMEERSITLDKLREDIGADIKIRKLLEAKTDALPKASEEQIKAYYDANKETFTQPESVSARHILIKTEEGATAEAKAAAKTKLEGIRTQIVEKKITFEEAATANSDCPSGKRGGDLGSFGRGQMVPAFEEAAFAQEIGAVGPVIESPFGYHVVLVSERQAAGERTLDQVRDEISEQLTMQEKQNTVQNYIEELRTKADIKYANQ